MLQATTTVLLTSVRMVQRVLTATNHISASVQMGLQVYIYLLTKSANETSS